VILGLIPARGGSKSILRKNLAMLGGKALIAWTIDAARACGSFDKIVVSSDDNEIIEAARALGAEAPFIRPQELALDATAMMPVVIHAVDALRASGVVADTVVLLQPTSPLRTSEDILACLALHDESDRPIVSVKQTKTNIAWMFKMSEKGRLSRYDALQPDSPSRRQDLPSLVVPNGAVYVTSARDLDRKHTFFDDAVGYLMPAERSLDIDEQFDLDLVRLIVGARQELEKG